MWRIALAILLSLTSGPALAAFAYESCAVRGSLFGVDLNDQHEINLLEGYDLQDGAVLELYINGAMIDDTSPDNPRWWLDKAYEKAREMFDHEILKRREGAAPEATVDASPTPPSARHEGKPSIAVLPFDTLGDEPEQSYFADGMTEDIITELSRFPELFVIARNSSFSYRASSSTPHDAWAALGVQYVVRGSVRKAGGRVRLAVQLIEAESGKHVWAERYDRELADVFALQDELTRGIVGVLPGRIESHESRKVARKPPQDMAAYELLLAGKIHHHRFTKEDCAKALELLDRAIALDPAYAAAHAWKACVLGQALGRGFLPEPKALFEGAVEAVGTALRLDENEVEAHRIQAEIDIEAKRLGQAERNNGRALSLNPNDPRLVAQTGELLT
jgi:adenylate cyclase